MRAVAALTVTLAVTAACKGNKTEAESEHAAEPVRVDIADPSACDACHAPIVSEWRESMHARSHHDRDPIYAGIRAIRMNKEGAEIAGACARCHTPGFESDPGAEAAAIGVACATCHNARVHAEAGQLLGPNDVAAGATTAHATGPASPALADGTTICMGCHESLDSPKGLSMCATGAEHATLDADTRAPCAACHMPRVPGPATVHGKRPDHASHAFLGPHRAWYQNDVSFAATAVATTAAIDGDTLTVRVANVSGHSFPTGFPGRQAIVACVGRDDSGAEVWRCEPRVLGKKYVDAAGEPTLAPYAETLAADTRIEPGGTATITAEVPKQVVSVEVTVALRLVPERLAAKLALGDAPEAEPRTIAGVTAARAAE